MEASAAISSAGAVWRRRSLAALRATLLASSALAVKMEKVQAGVERWQNEGRDPSEVGEIMQELEPLMQSRKFKEAEAVLDGALKVLGEK